MWYVVHVSDLFFYFHAVHSHTIFSTNVTCAFEGIKGGDNSAPSCQFIASYCKSKTLLLSVTFLHTCSLMFNFSENSPNLSLFEDFENNLKVLDQFELDSISVIKWLVISILAIFAIIALCECVRAWTDTKRYTFQNGRRSV